MIKGIGVDMVSISEVARYMTFTKSAFVKRTFTEKEVEASLRAYSQAEYLSTRFAVKEAVFKAIAHFTNNKGFDFRIVETLNECDGYPVIQVNEKLQSLLDEAGVESLQVTITTEGDYAMAFVIALTGIS